MCRFFWKVSVWKEELSRPKVDSQWNAGGLAAVAASEDLNLRSQNSKLVKTALEKNMSKVKSKYPEAEIRIWPSDPHSIRKVGHPRKGASVLM